MLLENDGKSLLMITTVRFLKFIFPESKERYELETKSVPSGKYSAYIKNIEMTTIE